MCDVCRDYADSVYVFMCVVRRHYAYLCVQFTEVTRFCVRVHLFCLPVTCLFYLHVCCLPRILDFAYVFMLPTSCLFSVHVCCLPRMCDFANVLMLPTSCLFMCVVCRECTILPMCLCCRYHACSVFMCVVCWECTFFAYVFMCVLFAEICAKNKEASPLLFFLCVLFVVVVINLRSNLPSWQMSRRWNEDFSYKERNTCSKFHILMLPFQAKKYLKPIYRRSAARKTAFLKWEFIFLKENNVLYANV